VVIALALAVVLAAVWYVYVLYFQPITVIDYKGYEIGFRADLRQAAKVPAYPGESEIYRDIMHQLAKNVTIVFKDAGEEGNPYYVVDGIELVSKMRLAYMLAFGMQTETGELVPGDVPTFDAREVSSYENLPGKIQNPIIAIVHPMYANETSVRNEGHVTFISGRNLKELDLATTKFLMIVLGIDSSDLDSV
ncbi:MAG: hypothetical protein ABIA12_01595, partial [Candidatus Aenigmatarchaeota archaeon]